MGRVGGVRWVMGVEVGSEEEDKLDLTFNQELGFTHQFLNL